MMHSFCFMVVMPFSDPSDMIEVVVADSCLIQASMEKRKGKKTKESERSKLYFESIYWGKRIVPGDNREHVG
jgi:hypothetical protein